MKSKLDSSLLPVNARFTELLTNGNPTLAAPSYEHIRIIRITTSWATFFLLDPPQAVVKLLFSTQSQHVLKVSLCASLPFSLLSWYRSSSKDNGIGIQWQICILISSRRNVQREHPSITQRNQDFIWTSNCFHIHFSTSDSESEPCSSRLSAHWLTNWYYLLLFMRFTLLTILEKRSEKNLVPWKRKSLPLWRIKFQWCSLLSHVQRRFVNRFKFYSG